MNNNHSKKFNLYTQGKRWAVRVWLIVGIFFSSLEGALAKRQEFPGLLTMFRSATLGALAFFRTGISLEFQNECSIKEVGACLSRDQDIDIGGLRQLKGSNETNYAIYCYEKYIDQTQSLIQCYIYDSCFQAEKQYNASRVENPYHTCNESISGLWDWIINLFNSTVEFQLRIHGVDKKMDYGKFDEKFTDIPIYDLSISSATFQLPDEIGQDTRLAQHLKWISLNYIQNPENNPFVLPADFENLKKLEEVYIKGGHISQLPENFGNLEQLKKLDLEETLISELPENFDKLEKLEELNLRCNKFKAIPEPLVRLVQKRGRDLQVDISENSLEDLPPNKDFLQLFYDDEKKGNASVKIDNTRPQSSCCRQKYCPALTDLIDQWYNGYHNQWSYIPEGRSVGGGK